MYASADAARVGGGLYQALVEALCTLATDPAPSVAAAGLAALRAAGVELVPVAVPGAGPVGGRGTAPASSRAPSSVGSGAMPVGTPGGGGSSLPGASSGGVTSMLPKSWQPKSWRSSSSVGGGGSSAGATSLLGGISSRQPSGAASAGLPPAGSSLGSAGGSAASSPTLSPGSGTFSRMPFVLRRAPDAGDSLHLQRGASQAYAEQRPMSSQGSLGSLDAYAAAAAAGGPHAAPHLPPSGIYASSCRAFTWPLLAPQSQVRGGGRVLGGAAWQQVLRLRGAVCLHLQTLKPPPRRGCCRPPPVPQEEPGPAYATWLLPPDESKVELRRQHVSKRRRACGVLLARRLRLCLVPEPHKR